MLGQKVQPQERLAAQFLAGQVVNTAGKTSLRQLVALLGEVDVHIIARRDAAPVAAIQRFAAPLANSDAALTVIESLAVRAGIELAARGAGGRRFGVTLFRSDGHGDRLAIDTAAPLRDAKVLSRLLRELTAALQDCSLLTLRWIKKNGGLKGIQRKNKTKAAVLYQEIDRNPLFKGTTAVEDRSLMNACFGEKFVRPSRLSTRSDCSVVIHCASAGRQARAGAHVRSAQPARSGEGPPGLDVEAQVLSQLSERG